MGMASARSCMQVYGLQRLKDAGMASGQNQRLIATQKKTAEHNCFLTARILHISA